MGDTSSDNVAVKAVSYKVQATKNWKGEELDDLSFNEKDIITVTKEDGAGWASGILENGNTGWFPLNCTEKVHETAVAEVGTNTGANALDVFIAEAKKKPVANLQTDKLKKNDKRNVSLDNFLASKPMTEQHVDKDAVLASGEIADELEDAKKRLEKMQKKRKKERADILIESLRNRWKPSDPFKLTEEQIDKLVVDIVNDIPLSKQKYHFSSYDDVFTGSVLLQHLKSHGHQVSPSFQSGVTAEQAKELAQNLLERNIIYDVADPGRKKFKAKCLYQLTSQHSDYSVLNFDKISCASEPPEPLTLSIQLVGEMIEIMKHYLPNFDKLRKSKQLKSFGLRLASLQQVSLAKFTEEQLKVFFVNIHNTLILYTHAKLSPPLNPTDKRLVLEHCSVYMNQKRYSIQDLEAECLRHASRSDPGVYFCISDCTNSTPAMFIFTEANYKMTELYAIRHFLNRTLVVDSSNYEITFPRLFQRIMKELHLNETALIDLVQPYCAREQREEIDKMKQVGTIEVKFRTSDLEPCYIFEEASLLSPR